MKGPSRMNAKRTPDASHLPHPGLHRGFTAARHRTRRLQPQQQRGVKEGTAVTAAAQRQTDAARLHAGRPWARRAAPRLPPLQEARGGFKKNTFLTNIRRAEAKLSPPDP